ncbi:MAG TPA: hypothetical protein VF505_03955 [Thermoanaerobaculia bacterium]
MTRLDDVMPEFQFRERHSIRIDATPDTVFEAIRLVRADEISFLRTMLAIRRGFRGGKESILNPARNTPILDVATRTGFEYLANDPPREVVIGMWVAPGVFAAMNFLVEDEGILSTETRAHAKSASARRRFALYWFVIRPGSGFIRWMWLRAIRLRAEQR